MGKLSPRTRHILVTRHKQGLSQAEISRQAGVSRCATQGIVKEHIDKLGK